MNKAVPEGWSLQPLSALANYYNGRAFKPDDWSFEGLPIIRIAQINNRNADLDYYAGNDVSEKNRIRNGDLLFSWSATLTALIWDRGDAVLNQHIFKVEEKTGVDRLFLHQLILNSIEPLAEHSHGSTMKHIKKSVLDEYCVETPPLPEQQKIAAILSSVDDVIEKTRAQIDKLKDLKTGMMQELLTKGIGSGVVPHTEFKDSPVGRVPEDWTVCALDHMVKGIIDCEHKTAPYVESSEYLVVRTTNVRHGQLIYEDMKFTTRSGFSEWTKRAVPSAGDVLFTREAPAGESCMVPGGVKICMGQRMVLLRPDTDKIYPFFFSLFLTSETAKLAIYELSIGTTVTRINIEDIRRIQCVLPPLEEQKAIYSKIQSIQSLITSKQEKLRSQSNVKKALMQDLLTGKVRVKIDQKESAVS